MVRLECHICSEHFLLDKFRFLRCGHGFCDKCTKKMESRPTCAFCSAPKQRGDPHPIYATFVLSEVERVASVLDGLSKIDAISPSTSINRASGKIRRSVDIIKPSDQLAGALLEAADDLEERVLPVFERVEEQDQEIQDLEQRIADLTKQNKKSKVATQEIQELRASLSEAESDAKQAWASYNEAAEMTARLRKRLKRKEEEVNEKNQTVSALQTQLEDQKKQLNLAKRKLKALSKPIEKVITHATELNNSLLVLDDSSSESEEENRRPSKPVKASNSSAKKANARSLAVKKRRVE